MQLELRMRNANLMESVREYAQRRLNFALDRYGSRIRRVTVRITDLNGPRGGVDKQCRIKMEVVPSGVLLLEETHSDVYAAISGAVHRVTETLERTLSCEKRRRDTREESLRFSE
jgi:putative sigma-54 modulation protein